MFIKCNYIYDHSITYLDKQNNFEWNIEHQARFEEIKKLLTEQISNTIPDSNQPFYAMCDCFELWHRPQHYYNHIIVQIK